MNIRQKLVNLFMWYQKVMWYAAQAGGEFGKPLRFMGEMGIVLTFVVANFGYKFTLAQIIGVYLILFVFAVIVGIIIVKVGVTKYVTSLQNTHNPELQRILNAIEKQAPVSKRYK